MEHPLPCRGSGGAKRTGRASAAGEWSPLYLVTGFQNHVQALQFEWALTHKHKGWDASACRGNRAKNNGRESSATPPRTKRRKYVSRAPGKGVPGRIRNLLRVLSLPRYAMILNRFLKTRTVLFQNVLSFLCACTVLVYSWTSKAVEAENVPLVVEWWKPDLRPAGFSAQLPSHVTQVDISPEQQDLILRG